VLKNGIHHVVMPSILETPPGRDAFASVDVLPGALLLRGHDACMALALRFAGPSGRPLGPPPPLRALSPWLAAAGGCEGKKVAAAAAAGERRTEAAVAVQVEA
jgi:hypothetical protein